MSTENEASSSLAESKRRLESSFCVLYICTKMCPRYANETQCHSKHVDFKTKLDVLMLLLIKAVR